MTVGIRSWSVAVDAGAKTAQDLQGKAANGLAAAQDRSPMIVAEINSRSGNRGWRDRF